MAEARVQRRLAAILAADVVGYSRLMGEDETGTLAALKDLRTGLIDPIISEHGGRVVKLMGDGALVEFASVVDAVECAVSIQRVVEERNADLPDNKRVAFRIGVNVGDVIIDGDDIYGDGVNIASRLEGLAEAGGVCISAKVYEEVGNKLDVTFEDLGPKDLKNIAAPVRAYRVTPGRVPSDVGVAALPLPDKPSIVVLPFTNMSGDAEQEYFSDGITEDIITALSRIRQFFVIARNTAFTYKGQSVDVPLVAKELGVRYVLEGSVRKAGARVRVTAQLIDGATGEHLWADRYDGDLEDIFAVQDEITQTVVGAIETALDRAEQDRSLQKQPGSVDTWDMLQKGLWHMPRFDKSTNKEAQDLLARIIETDPNFGRAYAALAMAKFVSYAGHYADVPTDAIEEGFVAAQKAVALDDRDDAAHRALAIILFAKLEYERAIEEFQRSLEINPSSAMGHHWIGWVYAFDHRPEDAIREQEIATRLNPNDPANWGFMNVRAYAYFNSKEFGQAADWAHRATLRPNAGPGCHRSLVASLGQLGQTDAAQEALEGLLKVEPHCSITGILETLPLKHEEDIALWTEGFRKAGVPE